MHQFNALQPRYPDYLPVELMVAFGPNADIRSRPEAGDALLRRYLARRIAIRAVLVVGKFCVSTAIDT